MLRDAPLLSENVYHIYNRGAHKADIFFENVDYERFKLLLYLANSKEPVHVANTLKRYRDKGRTFISIYSEEKIDQPLVDVLSYALMPNHFHLVLRQKAENGITEYMRKVSTAYTMYFNAKNDHSGTVFQGRFQSRYVDTGDYLRWLFAYVALNPLDVGFPGWKDRGILNPQNAFAFLRDYQHASFSDMQTCPARPEAVILSQDALDEVSEDVPDFSDINELFDIERAGIELVEN